ncbi:MAG: hypothetical protein IKS54_05840 [Erysipelotrichaceae bacterium]|nr:hypothetical protein [Erysipelotrichaceae bacterium]
MDNSLKQLICSSCGAPLDIKPGLRKTVCSYCGSVFVIENKEDKKDLTQNKQIDTSDNPADIVAVPMNYKEMSIINPFHKGIALMPYYENIYGLDKEFIPFGEWTEENNPGLYVVEEFVDINEDSDRYKIFHDELEIRYSLSYLLKETYELSLDFDFADANIDCLSLYENEKEDKGFHLFKSKEEIQEEKKRNAQIKASHLLDQKVLELSEMLGFEKPVLTKQGEIYNNWRISCKLTPELSKSRLSPDFLAAVDRASKNPVLDQIAEEMAKYLNLADGRYIKINKESLMIGDWVYGKDGDYSWYTCKYTPGDGIAYKRGETIITDGVRLCWFFKTYSMSNITDKHIRMAVLTALIPKILALTVENGKPRYVVRKVDKRSILLGRTMKYVKVYNEW